MSKLQHHQKAGVYLKLHDILQLLTQRYNAERIICFGCVTRNEIGSTCFTEQFHHPSHHYFLLMVRKDADPVGNIAQDYCDSHFHYGVITLLTHSIDALNDALQCRNPFFTEVIRQGILLFKADGLLVILETLPEADPVDVLSKAQKYAAHHSLMSRGFVRSAKECINNGYHKNAVFLLHQAMEQCLMGLIRVNLGYRFDIHKIARMLDLCKCFAWHKINAAFPLNTETDKRLLSVLQSSYSNSRYSSTFEVDADDAEELLIRVNRFLDMADTLINKRISQYTAAVQDAIQVLTDLSPALAVHIHP